MLIEGPKPLRLKVAVVADARDCVDVLAVGNGGQFGGHVFAAIFPFTGNQCPAVHDFGINDLRAFLIALRELLVEVVGHFRISLVDDPYMPYNVQAVNANAR